jgi:hypothetical protein
VESGKEPDIIVFHHACATADTTNNPSAVTLIEFKRPGRDTYSRDENPYTQIMKYYFDIKDGKAVDKGGKVFRPASGARYFGYIVADFTPKLEAMLRSNAFYDGPEHGSLIWRSNQPDLHIEAVSYDKMIGDAIRRNRSYFIPLGIQ